MKLGEELPHEYWAWMITLWLKMRSLRKIRILIKLLKERYGSRLLNFNGCILMRERLIYRQIFSLSRYIRILPKQLILLEISFECTGTVSQIVTILTTQMTTNSLYLCDPTQISVKHGKGDS